jgi:hypothetical protein
MKGENSKEALEYFHSGSNSAFETESGTPPPGKKRVSVDVNTANKRAKANTPEGNAKESPTSNLNSTTPYVAKNGSEELPTVTPQNVSSDQKILVSPDTPGGGKNTIHSYFVKNTQGNSQGADDGVSEMLRFDSPQPQQQQQQQSSAFANALSETTNVTGSPKEGSTKEGAMEDSKQSLSQSVKDTVGMDRIMEQRKEIEKLKSELQVGGSLLSVVAVSYAKQLLLLFSSSANNEAVVVHQ